MTRINVLHSYFEGADDGEGALAGWFDNEKCQEIVNCETDWDGNDVTAVHYGRYDSERLLLTAGGRWVIKHWTRLNSDQNPATYHFIDEAAARGWLLLNNRHDVAERRIGPVEEESGPNVGGRPEIGPAINVRFPPELLAEVDQIATARFTNRAAAIRTMAETYLCGSRWMHKSVSIPQGMRCEGEAATVIGYRDLGVMALLCQVKAPDKEWDGEIVAVAPSHLEPL